MVDGKCSLYRMKKSKGSPLRLMVIYVQILFFIAITSALSFKHVFCKLNIKTIYSISYYSFYFLFIR